MCEVAGDFAIAVIVTCYKYGANSGWEALIAEVVYQKLIYVSKWSAGCGSDGCLYGSIENMQGIDYEAILAHIQKPSRYSGINQFNEISKFIDVANV